MPTLTAAEPMLFVSDIRASTAWFADRLGFATAFVYGDPPFFAQVTRDGVRLNLRHVDTPVADRARAAAEDLLAVIVLVDDVAALAAEVGTPGATVHQALRQEPWGSRTVIVADPDGNLICFAGQ